MEYKRFGNKIVVRMDMGEEILEQLKAVALKENIKLCSVSALGATNDFTVGVYDVDKKFYKANSFKGPHEIVSLTGSVNPMNGEFYSHIHMAAADGEGHTFGGHLTRATVCPTCEMFLDVIDGEVDRFHDDATGLNLFKF